MNSYINIKDSELHVSSDVDCHVLKSNKLEICVMSSGQIKYIKFDGVVLTGYWGHALGSTPTNMYLRMYDSMDSKEPTKVVPLRGLQSKANFVVGDNFAAWMNMIDGMQVALFLTMQGDTWFWRVKTEGDGQVYDIVFVQDVAKDYIESEYQELKGVDSIHQVANITRLDTSRGYAWSYHVKGHHVYHGTMGTTIERADRICGFERFPVSSFEIEESDYINNLDKIIIKQHRHQFENEKNDFIDYDSLEYLHNMQDTQLISLTTKKCSPPHSATIFGKVVDSTDGIKELIKNVEPVVELYDKLFHPKMTMKKLPIVKKNKIFPKFDLGTKGIQNFYLDGDEKFVPSYLHSVKKLAQKTFEYSFARLEKINKTDEHNKNFHARTEYLDNNDQTQQMYMSEDLKITAFGNSTLDTLHQYVFDICVVDGMVQVLLVNFVQFFELPIAGDYTTKVLNLTNDDDRFWVQIDDGTNVYLIQIIFREYHKSVCVLECTGDEWLYDDGVRREGATFLFNFK